MSAVFRAYLWKEWREQRKLLGALALGLVLIVGMIVTFADWRDIDSSFTYTWVTVLCLCSAILTVGSDLFARERKGEQLGFLERLPAGLSMAFRAKLVFFLILIIASILFGLGITALGGLFFGEGVPRFSVNPWYRHGLAILITLSLWIFAVSTWAPSSVTAAPFAIVMLGVLVAPVAVFHLLMQRTIPWPLPYLGWFLGSLALGAILGVRVCFVNASSRSRSKWLAFCACVGFCFLALLPANTWAGLIWKEWQSRPYYFSSVTIGDSGRFAFLTLWRFDGKGMRDHRTQRALVVDLETGEWRFEGNPKPSFFFEHHGQLLLGSWPTKEELTTGDVVRVAQPFDPETGQFKDPVFEEESFSMPIEPADYGLDEFDGRLLVRESGLGYLAILQPRSSGNSQSSFRSKGGAQVLQVENALVSSVIVMHEGFLIRGVGLWQWIDPETKERTRSELLKRGDEVLALLDDGTLLVLRSDGLYLVDLDRGFNDPVALEGIEFEALSSAQIHSRPPIGPGGKWTPIDPTHPFMLQVAAGHVGKSFSQVATLDLDERVFRLTEIQGPYRTALVWSDAGECILANDDQQLIHHDLESGQHTVLFDVADLTR